MQTYIPTHVCYTHSIYKLVYIYIYILIYIYIYMICFIYCRERSFKLKNEA